MHFVNQPRRKILTDGGHSTPEPDVFSLSVCHRLLQGLMNPTRDEAELGTALHGERRSRMVGQDQHGGVKRRVVTPPTPPTIVRPRTTNRAEHVAAHDRGADPLEGACDKVVVGARRATDLLAVLLSKAASLNLPFMQRLTAYAKGSVAVLAVPAPKPSSETEKLCTRSRATRETPLVTRGNCVDSHSTDRSIPWQHAGERSRSANARVLDIVLMY